jgi:hypothetical protein
MAKTEQLYFPAHFVAQCRWRRPGDGAGYRRAPGAIGRVRLAVGRLHSRGACIRGAPAFGGRLHSAGQASLSSGGDRNGLLSLRHRPYRDIRCGCRALRSGRPGRRIRDHGSRQYSRNTKVTGVTLDGVWRKRERPKARWVGCSGAARRLRGRVGFVRLAGRATRVGRVEAGVLSRAC